MPHNLSMRRILPFVVAGLVLAVVLFLVLRPKPVAVDILNLAAADMQTSVVASGRVLPPALLKSDMTISMDLQGPLLKQALMLPADAVRQLQTEAPWVLVEREGVAVKVTVKVGLQTQGRVAITEGLKAGDRVILNREVEAGSRVRDRR